MDLRLLFLSKLNHKVLFLGVLLLTFGQGAAALALELELKPKIAKQGETVRVLLRGKLSGGAGAAPLHRADIVNKIQDATLKQEEAAGATGGAAPPVVLFHDKSFSLFPLTSSAEEAQSWRALIAVPADLKPGQYNIKVANEDYPLKVVDAHFGVQVLRLPKGRDNFKSSEGEEDAVNEAKRTLSPHQFWDSKFLRPSPARISSAFGLRRRVNGKLLTDYFHSGLDFAGAAGSPVTACQKGRVIIAHWGWKLHGNTVCIDHGQGVLSFYIHLSKIFVKEGDFVSAGQKIGAIGSTGRANGPHLHFSLYVNQDATNPLDWFSKFY